MNEAYLTSYGIKVSIRSLSDVEEFIIGLDNLFARRYIPSFSLGLDDNGEEPDVIIEWKKSDEYLKVSKATLGDTDEYQISSSSPRPYLNESPYFFILQVLSRAYVKKGFLMFTDTVSIYNPAEGTAYLLMGYPHTGKSTLLALALVNGYTPLTTENTLIQVAEDGAEITGGTNVLVFDPKIKEIYGVDLKPVEVTKHGYGIIDLSEIKYPPKATISTIYVIYCSFASRGASLKEVRGRKALKTLWHFSNSIIRGLDFYEPYPLNLSDANINSKILTGIKRLSFLYERKFYEIFGSHPEVLKKILEG